MPKPAEFRDGNDLGEPKGPLSASRLWAKLYLAVSLQATLPDAGLADQLKEFRNGLVATDPDHPARSLFYFKSPLYGSDRDSATTAPEFEAILQQEPAQDTLKSLYDAAENIAVIGRRSKDGRPIEQTSRRVNSDEFLHLPPGKPAPAVRRVSVDLHEANPQFKPRRKGKNPYNLPEGAIAEIEIEFDEQKNENNFFTARYKLTKYPGAYTIQRHDASPIQVYTGFIHYPNISGSTHEYEWLQQNRANGFPFIPCLVRPKLGDEKLMLVGEFEASNLALTARSDLDAWKKKSLPFSTMVRGLRYDMQRLRQNRPKNK